jgi:hypothetical protein
MSKSEVAVSVWCCIWMSVCLPAGPPGPHICSSCLLPADGSQDPDNWLPVSALVGFLGVGPMVSQSRAGALGAEVYKAPPGSGQENHIR